MSSDDDRGYVHRPGDADSRPSTGDDATGAAAATGEDPTTSEATATAPGFGSRGWVLVGVLVGCTLVVPGIIYLRPGILAAVGIPYIASLLVLPLLPAAALGLTAVWAMTAATRGEE
ncbi:hypothetical protein GCM10008995_09840 [Halobellus salinus]|uniref:Uncharacterized protein n=1 Tax=Halobellus salinus TaxID=931585 RepID=A0A830EM11_9EURY|nr:hypothetical protein [Halobellus salinus]GGJ02145.1 hypothetical protein GCM10008995_09840 [Halobellus salinus]SMP17792.1 hypothetical protein SAMN06265347_10695 [Halobellus salinus]